MKNDLEKLNLSYDNNSIASLDIVDFYPSVSYRMIEKAVWHFATNLQESEKRRLAIGLEFLKAGMSNQILQFNGTYYKYKGADNNDPGLTIGGFGSAYCSDLVVAMIFDKVKKKLFQRVKLLTKKGNRYQSLIFNKIYRDDGIIVTEKKWTISMFHQWLDLFQAQVNNILKSDKLQFTLDIWNFNDEPTELETPNNISINSENKFPFLDMYLFWKTMKSDGDLKWKDGGVKELCFNVYHKPNQRLKYLNAQSTHKRTVFHAIPKGVFHRLASLTTFDSTNTSKTVDELYPIHAKALIIAGLVNEGEFPILS